MKTHVIPFLAAIILGAQAAAGPVVFDFNTGPQYSPLPITLTVGGVTAHFSATGQGFSLQDTAQVIGVLPAGFSGLGIVPSSVYAADLVVTFDQPLTDFSILYAPQELACDSSATMRVTAYHLGSPIGSTTTTANPPGTWPAGKLTYSSAAGFEKVVIHYDAAPPTGGDWGPIFVADNMTVTPVNYSSNPTIATLRLSAGKLSPTFASATANYTAVVPNATTSVTVTPGVAVTGLTVTVNGTPVASGKASGAINLAFGANIIKVGVTDGKTTKTYLVTVFRGVKGDFNQDGNSDLVFVDPTTSITQINYLSGGKSIGTATGPALPAGWVLVDVADFDGDGKPDFALYNRTTHRTAVWFLDGANVISNVSGPTVPSNYDLVAVADFNNDRHPDFVILNPTTGQTTVWFMKNATTYASGAYFLTVPKGLSLVGVGDFDADTLQDFVFYNPTTQATAIWYAPKSASPRTAIGPTIAGGYTLAGIRDTDSDGRPEFILANKTTQQAVFWDMRDAVCGGTVLGPTPPAGYILVSP